jgi:hypothetical protein
MRHQKESNRIGHRYNQFSLAAIAFVALMFLTISGVNLYMQSDRTIRQAGGAQQERAGASDPGEMDHSSASR